MTTDNECMVIIQERQKRWRSVGNNHGWLAYSQEEMAVMLRQLEIAEAETQGFRDCLVEQVGKTLQARDVIEIGSPLAHVLPKNHEWRLAVERFEVALADELGSELADYLDKTGGVLVP